MSISPVASSSRSQSPVDSQQALSPELAALVDKAKAAAQVSTSLPIFIKQMERKVAKAGQDLNVQLATLVYAAMADQTKTDFSPAICALMRQLPDNESFDAAKNHLLKYVGTDGNQAKFAKNGTLQPLAELLTRLEYQAPAAKTVEEEPQADETLPEDPTNEAIVELEDAPQAASSSGCSRKWLIAIPVMAAAATGFYLLHKWNAEQNSCGAENPLDPSFRQLTLWDTASTFAQTSANALRATVSDWMAVPSYTGTKPSLFETAIPNSTPVQSLFESAAQTVQQLTAPVVERNFTQPVCSAAEAFQQALPTSFLTDHIASAAQTVQQLTAPVVERNFTQPVCSAAEAFQQALPTSSLTGPLASAVQTVQQWTAPVVERNFSQPVCSAAEAVAATVKETVQALPAPGDILDQTAKKAQEVIQITLANLKPAAKKITFPTKFASNLRVVANSYCMAVGRICIPICNQAGQLIKPVMNHLGQYIQPKAPWISCNPIKF